MIDMENKKKLIKEIKILIATHNEDIPFNEKYIDYFEIDELLEIKDTLENKKQTNENSSKDYLDEIFNNCS
jgi:uncharacterized protein with ACT and thioredoxin-like domain